MRLHDLAIALMILATSALSSGGQSQELHRSPSEATQSQEQKATTDNKAAPQSDQKKVEAPPISVSVLPVLKADHEAEDERQERKEKAELDRRLVALTADLARFTAGLFVATAALVIATIALAYYAAKQSRDMKSSIELSREEFIATHRPRVIVRYVQGPWIDDQSMVRTAYVTVVNIGVNPAVIEAFGGDIAYRNKYDWLPPGLDASPKAITSIILASGQRHSFPVSAKNPVTDVDIFAEATGSRTTCLVGCIRYGDGRGIVRETAFFRTYNEKSETFTASDNIEDEYQD